MTTKYAALKVLLAQPAYAALNDEEAAQALNAPSVERQRVFAWHEARGVLQIAGCWPVIVARSRYTPALPPDAQTYVDAAILAAIGAVEMQGDQQIDPADADAWAAFQQAVDVLAYIGDVPAAIASRVAGLATDVVSPAQTAGFDLVGAGEVARARALGASA